MTGAPVSEPEELPGCDIPAIWSAVRRPDAHLAHDRTLAKMLNVLISLLRPNRIH